MYNVMHSILRDTDYKKILHAEKLLYNSKPVCHDQMKVMW